MVAMDTDHAVATIVEAMLPRFSDLHKVLVMTLEITVREKKNFNRYQRRLAHLMFHRPGNYTKVLWNVSREKSRYFDFKEWRVEADHDSCWQSDGIESPLRKLAEDMAREIYLDWTSCERTAGFFIFSGKPKLIDLKSCKYDSEKRTFTVEYA